MAVKIENLNVSEFEKVAKERDVICSFTKRLIDKSTPALKLHNPHDTEGLSYI